MILYACLKGVLIHLVVGPHCVEVLRYFASKGTDIQGDSSLNTPNSVNVTFRQPYGVCGAIIPWNGPLFMFCLKVGPALVSGNTLILKSSEKSPLSALVLARLCQEIGLPKGVLNILSGLGRPCGEAMAKHMEIRHISFTGSHATGKAIKKASAESNLKHVTLELGGKNPLLIFDDADLSKAVPAATVSALVNSGQGCILSSRIYVHADIAEQFIEGLKGRMATIFIAGDPLVKGTGRGPQADKLQFERVIGFLNDAKEQRLDIFQGGGRIGSKGYFIEPTIIKNPPETSRVMREEIFGPVVCVSTFTDEEEVLTRANDTEFGLYASIFTRDISRALRFAKKMEAGTVGVNCTSPTTAMDMPFGGWKQSGDGGFELSKYATDGWTQVKTVLIAL
jgi:aldehyde dehydrogenase (NAD+)